MGGDRDGAPEVPDGRTEAPRSPPSAMSRLRELLDISDATSLTQSPTPSRARDRAVRTGDAGGDQHVTELCELCGIEVAQDHGHVVDLETRALACVCRACYLLSTSSGAGAGKRRAVPRDYRRLSGSCLGPGQWDDLQIPVGIAFFFENSQVGRVVAFYPSPAGATESLLPLGAWDSLVAAHPELRAMQGDVEALVIRQRGATDEAFIVPIDVCYELVGRMRQRWKGFHGGVEVWQDVDAFFETVGARCDASVPPGMH